VIAHMFVFLFNFVIAHMFVFSFSFVCMCSVVH